MIPKIGDDYPVWWDTNDGRPAGAHMAKVMGVLQYCGPLDFVKCILVLSAPNTRRGQVEMSFTG